MYDYHYHIEVDGIEQAHADTIAEARMVASYLTCTYAYHNVVITYTDGIGWRRIEKVS